MSGLILSFCCFSGFIYASCHWLKIRFSYAPLFSVSLIGILLYIAGLTDSLESWAMALTWVGYICCGVGSIHYFKIKQADNSFFLFRPGIVFVFLFVFSFVITLGMRFTVIDDYVYWGIMGKYLWLNNALPLLNNPLDERILAYTPGTSLVHYFFYQISDKYSVNISYFAQNIILVSGLFMVVKKEQIIRSLYLLGFLIILLTLFFGSIFTKLQVDYLLAILFFAVLWIWYNDKDIFLKLRAISAPLCFLFLIKEIGFVLGLFLWVIILFDLLFYSDFKDGKKFKPLFFVFLLGVSMVLLRLVWTSHCNELGFVQLNSPINVDTIKGALNIPGSQEVKNGFIIFMKSVLIGPADRLNIPYLFWYLLVGIVWYRLFRTHGFVQTRRYRQLMILMVSFFLFYLIMLYFLQIILFKVGSVSDHSVGLTRYMNIVLSQIVMFTVLTWFQYSFPENLMKPNKILVSIIAAALLILVASRVETYLHRDRPDIQAEQVAEKIQAVVEGHDIKNIGVITGKNHQNIRLKLLYHLLPHRVDYKNIWLATQDGFATFIKNYDYIIMVEPDSIVFQWANAYTESASLSGKYVFLKVLKKSDNNNTDHISIKPLFNLKTL
jgi:hypothetical protein